ncbi:sulfite exporter TauE/SafE family protein [Candidatus Entotheonella serta]|nr:sulfite exporter TauE/SafE family protein [Candidatus Entotheonella serta]
MGEGMGEEHHMAMTSLGFFALLGAGFFTGLSHCVGMCGPLVGAFTLQRRAAKRELSASLVIYQMGRLSMYFLLGAVVGSLGEVLATALQPWQGAFSMAMGGMSMLLGLGLMGVLPLPDWHTALAPARLVSRYIRGLMVSSHPVAPFGLGIANGLLPCGAVYAMTLLAAMSGSPVEGASLMLIFGFGTLPAMLGVGYSVGLLRLRLQTHLFRVAAMVMVVVGVQLVLRGLALNGYIPQASLGGVVLW